MPDPDSIRIIALIAVAVFFVIGIVKPFYMVVSFITLHLCKLSHYYPFLYQMRAETIVGAVSFLRVVMVKDSLKKINPYFNLVSKYLFLFIASIILSFLFAINQTFSWENIIFDFIKVLIIFFISLGVIEKEEDLKKFSWFFVILFTYLSYEPLYGFLTGTGGVKLTYGENYISKIGILSGHVATANNMNQMIPIALFLFLSIQNKNIKVIGFIPLVVFIVVLIGSGSRGGVIGFMVFCVVTFLLSKNHVKSGIIVVSAVIIILATSATFIYTGSRISERAIRGRLNGLSHGIEIVLKGHPFGVGPGCFMLARGKYFGFTMMSHNLYGELIGDLGIPGTVVWFLFIRQIFINLFMVKKRLELLGRQNEFLYKLTIGLLISLIVRLIIGMGSHGLYYFYWYLIGALSIMCVKIMEDVAPEKFEDEQRYMSNCTKKKRELRNYGEYQKNT